jgi:rhomboid protease GluP
MMEGRMDSRRMCPHCRAFITSKDKVCPYCKEPVGPRAIDVREPGAIGGLIPAARFNTMLLMGINVFLYVLTLIVTIKSGRGTINDIDGYTLRDFGAKYGPKIAEGQWWRYVTAGFLHQGIFHIAMNMWVLYDVGAQVEEIYGASRMYVIYFAANFCGFFLSNAMSGGLSIGASAGVAGLIGAMIVVGIKDKSRMGDAIRRHYVGWVIWIIVIGLLPGLRTDNAAHIGGLVGGFAVAWIAQTPLRSRPTMENLWKLACVFCVVITAVSFLAMYLSFSQNAQ